MANDPRLRIATLASLSLAGSGLRRDLPVPQAAQTEEFVAAYDFDTLWYDAIRTPRGVTLVTPRLFNLTEVLRGTDLTVAGAAARIKRVRRFRRHQIVDLNTAGPGPLTLRHGDFTAVADISLDQSGLFAGMNTVLTVSKNNRLDWIRDFTRFHIDEHGLEAFLFFDNGSKLYPPQAILDTLSGLPLKRVVVVPVAQGYGPTRVGRGSGGMNFLQVALQAIARLRFLGRARAVMLSDIDELVWRTGPTLFDAAVASPLGLALWPGHWVVPRPDTTEPAHHGDHSHMAPELGGCPTKYAIVPQGRLRGMQWDVHRPEGLPFRRWLARRDLGYWHCKGITDNWKATSERGAALSASHQVPELAAKLAERFG